MRSWAVRGVAVAKSTENMDQAIFQRLPTADETVELKCLMSTPHLIGKRGNISTYVSDPDTHRY